ncbi:hypothetical protein HUFFLYPUFF_90 [Mycobacterium phage HufflyPuff]|uniref:hypothetical protein n=1 Tax=Mycobacterium phage HufflyPuff TaxID=1430411 RepID=UPI0003C9E0DC|nr:hypothetical protein HUFFLYPUFF_90 [Mycobacterium phage HufflyPuff]AHB31258.1 hypothetical protein HUFFLYPUFF_90 [Mycobacterium phage HufflyPuff]
MKNPLNNYRAVDTMGRFLTHLAILFPVAFFMEGYADWGVAYIMGAVLAIAVVVLADRSNSLNGR